MSTLNIAGNLIFDPVLSVPIGGHLQVVRISGQVQDEIEVQAPTDFGAFGQWVYYNRRHDIFAATPTFSEEGGTLVQPDDYGIVQIDLGGRDADDVWNALVAIHQEFFLKGNFEYNPLPLLDGQNSNSYVNTLLYMIELTFLTTSMLLRLSTELTIQLVSRLLGRTLF